MGSSKQAADAIDMLIEDHRAVEKLFKSFEKIKDGDDEQAITDIVTTACAELEVHSKLEEEIFYPAVREAATDEELTDLLAEAEVEHESVDLLVEKLSTVKLADDMYKANFTVVMEYVKHHVKEEEEEMFPKVRKLKNLDLDELASTMAARKMELMEEVIGESLDMDAAGKPIPGQKSKSPNARAGR